jgi:hypothetical protein
MATRLHSRCLATTASLFRHSAVSTQYKVFQKELCNGIANVTVRRVLRKRLHLKAYKLSIVQGAEASPEFFQIFRLRDETC